MSFDNFLAIKDLSFQVAKGDSLAIIGPNGAGKTVLFRALLGLVPYSGVIRWGSKVKIGYVPQRLTIDKSMPLSVGEFFSFKAGGRSEIFEALEAVGLSHHAQHILEKRLGDLSGGEFQKVLIAYAIIGQPDVLLFDEPTAGIDMEGEETVYGLLERLHAERGMTILLISHDLNVIYRYAHNVLCINRSQICFGAPKEVLTTKSLQELYGSATVHPHKHVY